MVSVESASGGFNKAKEWCKSLGGEWRLPLINDLKSLYKVLETVNAAFAKNGFWDKIYKHCYWTSELSDGVLVVDFNDGNVYKDLEDGHNYVCAVVSF